MKHKNNMSKVETFIEKARKVHGNAYDYSRVEYKGSNEKVCIICPEHGEFWQTPAAHVRGNSCPKCANLKRGRFDRLDTELFIDKAKEVHGDKYDYSKTVYINARNKVCIICPEHGEFWQNPASHLQGLGCPKCAGQNRNNDDFIKLAKNKHGDKYDYSKSHFTKMNEKVCIICPEHGEFWQTPAKHLRGQGCPVCAKENTAKKICIQRDDFIKRAREIHGDKYDYSKINFETLHDKIEIICPTHGSFYQYAYDHLNGHACPHCGCNTSEGENEIYKSLQILIPNVEKRKRGLLGDGREIDIYISDRQIGIEYNGLRWHTEYFGKDKFYHLNKTEAAQQRGIKLIQIFEDEYLGNKELVIKKLRHIIGENKDLPKIMARKCKVVEINNALAKVFLNKNHIQGYSNTTMSLGCYYQEHLVGVMCFTKENMDGYWILNRFATDNDYICNGVGGKLFSYFIRNYNPIHIKSFADRRWTLDETNNLYTKLGFKLTEVLKPEYRYVSINNPNRRIHKFNLRKKEIHRRYGMDMDMTEKEMVEKIGLTKIWDCGLYRYEWTKKALE